MMKNINTKQVDLNTLNTENFHAIICASGFEDRCIFFAKNNPQILNEIKDKYCLGFDENIVFSRTKNDTFFSNHGFELNNCNGDLTVSICNILEKIISNTKEENLNILIDYSSMTRVWYAEILNFFNNRETAVTINLFFVYTYSKYQSAPKDSSNNVHVGPISGFSSLSTPHKPTALIIGLGYERNRAFGLTEYLDAETFIFYTDNLKSKKFSKEIEKANEEILSRIDKKNIYRYPINDLKYTEFLLSTLCYDLIDDYRIIIAPCGPKPFTLLSLLISSKYNDIDVWRISPGNEAPPLNREADGEFSIFKVSYLN